MLHFFSGILRVIAIGIVTLITTLGININRDTTFYSENTKPINIAGEKVVEPNSTSTTTASSSTTLVKNIEKPATTSITKKPQISSSTKIATKVATTSEKISLSINTSPLPLQKIFTVSELNEKTRKAVINILCTTETSGDLNPITGTGVIIDERGVILTNAHIAQYLLLKDFPRKNNVSCNIRAGSPASPLYTAKLLYISPVWIESNYKNIKIEKPIGTGEHDFALLYIDGTVSSGVQMPTSFPALVPNLEELDEGGVSNDTYVVASYPAGFLGGIAVQKDLFLTSASMQAQKIFTFKEKTIDLIGLGGSAVAQKGSSGGAVTRQSDGKLVGIVVTTSEEKSTSERDLRAVTTSHINRSLEASTNKSIPDFLKGDLSQKVKNFEESTFIYLKSILVNELTS